MTTSIPPDTGERAAALFEYLTKLVELRSRPVRDIADYEEHIWFADVPDQPEVISALGASDAVEEWLAVRRPRLRERPPLPPELLFWVDQDSLSDTAAPPEMKAAVVEQDGTTTYPDERARGHWARYREQWDAWASERLRIQPVFDLYQRLFEMQQRSAQLGEQYEIVVGLGLLFAQSSTGPVRRHLITARGKIDYEAATIRDLRSYGTSRFRVVRRPRRHGWFVVAPQCAAARHLLVGGSTSQPYERRRSTPGRRRPMIFVCGA